MKKKAFLILFLFLFSFGAQSQSEKKNLEKYWHYKERLHHYFVKVGPNVGESVVAYVRNKYRRTKRGYTFGDQTIDLAWYIGILATEYRLLTEQNENTEETLQALYYAIKAFERLDRCENNAPWNLDSARLDGFFHRYDVLLYQNPKLFSLEGRNFHLTNKDTWGTHPAGMPTYISSFDNEGGRFNPFSAEESQDQLIHLLMGFSLVSKCLPDSTLEFYNINHQKITYNFKKSIIENTDRIISYISNNSWNIKNPKGKNVGRGATVIMYAYPIAIIGERITGKTYTTFWSQLWFSKIAWDLSRIPNWVNDFNSTMALTLAALSNSWYDMLPFSHIDATGYYIRQCGKVWHRDIFYQLLYEFVNDKKSRWYQKEETIETLNIAPYNGPYYWSQDSVVFSCCGKIPGKPKGGWAYPNKYRGTKKEQEGLGRYPTSGNFSGIDYMLLYNLYQLVEHPIPYQKPKAFSVTPHIKKR